MAITHRGIAASMTNDDHDDEPLADVIDLHPVEPFGPVLKWGYLPKQDD